MVEIAKNIAVFVGLFLSIISALTILIKPLRKWFINRISKVNNDTLSEIKNMLKQHIDESEKKNQSQNEALLCITRSEITTIYYKYFDKKILPTYVRENLITMYDSYERNGGNSYVHTIVDEMLDWNVVK